MKTLWLFINLQLLCWCLGMALAERHAPSVFPRDAYIVAGGSFLAGLFAFFWLNPKIDEFSSWFRLVSLVIFAGGLYYLPMILPLLQAKWGIG